MGRGAGGRPSNGTRWDLSFVAAAVRALALFHESWRCCAAAGAAPTRILKYEALVADPAAEVAGLVAWLEERNPPPRGAPDAAARVACAVAACTLARLRKTDPAYLRTNATTIPPPDLDAFFGGRDATARRFGGLAYTPAMLALFGRALGPFLERFAYAPPAPGAPAANRGGVR